MVLLGLGRVADFSKEGARDPESLLLLDLFYEFLFELFA